MEQTAVEWLVEQLCIEHRVTLIEKAKEMERQQIIEAYRTAEDSCEWLIEEHKWQRFHSEQYYNKTFNKM